MKINTSWRVYYPMGGGRREICLNCPLEAPHSRVLMVTVDITAARNVHRWHDTLDAAVKGARYPDP